MQSLLIPAAVIILLSCITSLPAQESVSVNQPINVSINPTVRVCPIANCPSDHLRNGILKEEVRSAFSIQGATRLGEGAPEWESVVGLYVNTGSPQGQKVAQYVGAVQGPEGGTTWSLNTDTVRNGVPNGTKGQVGSSAPGTPSGVSRKAGTIGYELDFTNWDRDCNVGGCFAIGQYIHNQSKFPSLSAIYLDSSQQLGNPFAWHNGIFFAGKQLVGDNTIYDATHSSFSYQISGQHRAAIYDNSRSRFGLHVAGEHSDSDIMISDSAPEAVQIRGEHKTAAIDTTRAETSRALMAAPGQSVCFGGTGPCVNYNAGARKWIFTNTEGNVVASINEHGDAIFKGTVVQNHEP